MTPAEEFWARVDRRGPDECWPWMGSRGKRDYGELRWGDRNARAHRVALTLTVGPPPSPGLFACHHCDNPPCCNPAHIYWGTPADNVRDMRLRGRASGGRARKTTCPNGHPYPEPKPDGASHRRCPICFEANQVRKLRRRGERYRALRAAGFSYEDARRLSARPSAVPVIFQGDT